MNEKEQIDLKNKNNELEENNNKITNKLNNFIFKKKKRNKFRK